MRRPPRFNVATLVFTVAFVVATTLVVILLRNPATHANLEAAENYDRTPLAYFDQEYPYLGLGAGRTLDPGVDPLGAGHLLYVRAGCAGCHGVVAQGGAVAKSLWDADAEDFPHDVRDGPSGMPGFQADVLSDGEIDLILRFVRSAPDRARELGVTTTTITPPTAATTAPPSTTTTAAPGDTTTTAPGATSTTTTTAGGGEPLRLDAPVATITTDGDPSDWQGIPSLDLTLMAIEGEDAPPKAASLTVAHDDSFIYLLYTVVDDFEWSDVDPHFSPSPAVMWPIEGGAGPHMGGEDPSGKPSLGLVDIWYWRLDCPIGVEQGGAVHGPGSGDPGNDGTCNLDDEWATEPETVEDDVGDGAENSLLGVFGHSNPVADGDGTWYFELRRPLQTGDPSDVQFVVGETVRLALAYWDPDAGQNGWGRRDHVQSSYLGWIDVVLVP